MHLNKNSLLDQTVAEHVTGVTAKNDDRPQQWSTQSHEHTADFADAFAERAAIRDFDGRMTRAEAEAAAHIDVNEFGSGVDMNPDRVS
jgi:hypothetical protein